MKGKRSTDTYATAEIIEDFTEAMRFCRQFWPGDSATDPTAANVVQAFNELTQQYSVRNVRTLSAAIRAYQKGHVHV